MAFDLFRPITALPALSDRIQICWPSPSLTISSLPLVPAGARPYFSVAEVTLIDASTPDWPDQVIPPTGWLKLLELHERVEEILRDPEYGVVDESAERRSFHLGSAGRAGDIYKTNSLVVRPQTPRLRFGTSTLTWQPIVFDGRRMRDVWP